MGSLRFDLHDLYTRMAEIRQRAGLRQADMAKVMGVDRRTYGRWETGQCYPEPLRMIALLQVLIGMEADALYNA